MSRRSACANISLSMALAILLTAFVALADRPAAASGAEPSYETRFSNPFPDGDPDEDLEHAVEDLLAQTPPGAEVRASYYTWSRTNISEAFIDAVERGVDVQILISNENVHAPGEYWAAVQLMMDEIPDNVTMCNEHLSDGRSPGCIGDNINHNKLLLISELDDGSENVVVQSTANFTNPQIRAHNNMVIIRDDGSLYDQMRTYWDDMSAQELNPDYHWVAEGDSGTTAHFSPRSDGGDPIVEALDGVECSDDSVIRIAASHWTGARPAPGEKLGELIEDGCDVQVLLNDSINDVTQAARDQLTAIGADITLYSLDETSLHLKYILVESDYAEEGSTFWRELVWTGSHNFNGPSLHSNDEVLMRVEDQPTYDQFAGNWETVKHLAETGEYPERGCADNVAVGGVDSGVAERVLDASDFVGIGYNQGCVADTIQDARTWSSKAAFQNHVAAVTDELATSGALSGREGGWIRAAAAQSPVGR